MSVQVRRRREAAGFLSSYVGAQGELLVDTTNNRVQVHDGATPGGWPAAAVGDLSGRNAVLNGNFAINQRGATSGTALAAGVYAHDRWKAGTNGCAYTFAQGVPDTTVTVTAGTLVQAVDASNVYATTWWLTWLGTAQVRVWQGSASGTFSAGTKIAVGGVTINALPVSGLTVGTITDIEFSTGTLGLVQFEAALPNAGPTRFERRHGELALCQRYFQYLQPWPGVIVQPAPTLAELAGSFVCSMRAIPTATLVPASTPKVTVPGVVNVAVQSINNTFFTTGGGTIDLTVASGATGGSPCNLLYQSQIQLSAEL